MGAQVSHNGKSYYKADNGKLYQDYNAAAKAAPAAQAARKSAEQAVIQKGKAQIKTDSGFGGLFSNFNPVEAVLGAALNNPASRAIRGGVRMAGNALGQGDTMDALDNAIRGVTGDRTNVNPSSYSGSGRTKLANSIDAAYKRGATQNDAGYVPVGYSDYDDKKSSLITGAMFGRKNSDGSYEISPDERYDFNASSATDKQEYKKNLDTATGDAVKRGSLISVIANAPDYLNYYTGAGGRGMNIGGTFKRPDSKQPNPTPDSPNYAAAAIKPTAPAKTSPPAVSSSYSVKSGDTLSSIAAKRGMSVADIAKKNNIQNINQINIGQSLTF